jgi:hypothetical protein
MENPAGVEWETYLLAAYTRESAPVLGDIFLQAQQQYWGKHENDTGSTSAGYQSIARFYLGFKAFFGDPSLRLPSIVSL